MKEDSLKVVSTYVIPGCKSWNSKVEFVKIFRARIKKNTIHYRIYKIIEGFRAFFAISYRVKNYDVLITCSDRVENLYALSQIFNKNKHDWKLNHK